MRTLAITGGIACGKSCVGRILVELGLEVLDTDHVGHDVIAAGTAGHQKVVEAFGETVLASDGEIDRRALGARVFADDAQRELLNRIVHPRIRTATQAWLDAQAEAGVSAVAVLVPLLFETSFMGNWDAVCCVGSTREIQVERLKERGLSKDEAARRIDAQLPLDEKMRRSDYVIFNAWSLDLLREQTERTWMRILETKHVG